MTIESIVWETDADTLFGTATSSDGHRPYRLIVEKLPSGMGWDWSVWRAGDPSTAIGHGTGFTSANAQASAEEAARVWDAANRQ
jgi:hypothetical protein